MTEPLATRSLPARRAALVAAEPRLYPRDLAARLGVTEAEIVALDEGDRATRLRPEWPELLGQLRALGPVMALTRNGDAVHEKIGAYPAFEGNARLGLFVGEAIDLRLFLDQWAFAWALAAAQPGGRMSLQFFAADGGAVHKVFATPDTDLTAWQGLVEGFAAVLPPPRIVPLAAPPAPRADDAIDREGLLRAWDGLRDTHHFHGMLKRFGVARTQALRLAGEGRARPVGRDSLRQVLEAAARSSLPIMVFVGNQGCIQIHTGPVAALKATGPWLNVLDGGFNLHLRETAIESAWVVAKPTDDGVVTSLELFDAGGAAIATLFGRRKPGEAESAAWRAICAGLAGA